MPRNLTTKTSQSSRCAPKRIVKRPRKLEEPGGAEGAVASGAGEVGPVMPGIGERLKAKSQRLKPKFQGRLSFYPSVLSPSEICGGSGGKLGRRRRQRC